jgi:hypothetical protein
MSAGVVGQEGATGVVAPQRVNHQIAASKPGRVSALTLQVQLGWVSWCHPHSLSLFDYAHGLVQLQDVFRRLQHCFELRRLLRQPTAVGQRVNHFDFYCML